MMTLFDDELDRIMGIRSKAVRRQAVLRRLRHEARRQRFLRRQGRGDWREWHDLGEPVG